MELEIRNVNKEGQKLQEEIKANSKRIQANLNQWEREQETYKHQLHNELMQLNDTRSNISHLNEQIRLIILLQKKTKANQASISSELKDAFDAIKKIKAFTTLEDLNKFNKKSGGKGIKSQQTLQHQH